MCNLHVFPNLPKKNRKKKIKFLITTTKPTLFEHFEDNHRQTPIHLQKSQSQTRSIETLHSSDHYSKDSSHFIPKPSSNPKKTLQKRKTTRRLEKRNPKKRKTSSRAHPIEICLKIQSFLVKNEQTSSRSIQSLHQDLHFTPRESKRYKRNKQLTGRSGMKSDK